MEEKSLVSTRDAPEAVGNRDCALGDIAHWLAFFVLAEGERPCGSGFPPDLK